MYFGVIFSLLFSYSALALAEPSALASCLSFEQGSKRECVISETEDAFFFCAENYGNEYLPFQLSKNCTPELADKLYGYVPSEKLNEGLESQLADVESVMTMIDRQEMRKSLTGYISQKPILKKEFETTVVKNLIKKLLRLKEELRKRSGLKVKINTIETTNFVHKLYRYIGVVSRLHAVYAYVAHQNDTILKTFDFKKLNYLNLIVKKDFALEIMAKISMKAKNRGSDYVEFLQSEQNYLQYEYQAISEPKKKSDYAKLVTFIGLRNSLTNLWALDNIYEDDLLDFELSKGQEFLNMRKSFGKQTLAEIPLIKENIEYKDFYENYLQRAVKEIIPITERHHLLTKDNTEDLLIEIFEGNQFLFESIPSVDFARDAESLMVFEKEYWSVFAHSHFKTIILPGDDITNLRGMAKLITAESFERRKKAIISGLKVLYYNLSDTDHLFLERYANRRIEEVKEDFEKKLTQDIYNVLESSFDKESKVAENFNSKIRETLHAAKKGVYAAKTLVGLERGDSNYQKYSPTSYEELVLLFETKMSREFHDLKYTLEADPELASSLTHFFQTIALGIRAELETLADEPELSSAIDDKEKAERLFTVFLETVNKYYPDNEFQLIDMSLVPNAVQLAKDPNLLINPYMIQVYESGDPVVMHVNDLYKAFQPKIGISLSRKELDMRVAQRQIFGVLDQPFFGTLERRYPKDERTTLTDGSFGRPHYYVHKAGTVIDPQMSKELSQDSLKRLYLASLDTTKEEIGLQIAAMSKDSKPLSEKEKETIKKDKEKLILKTPQAFFARVFELFNVSPGQRFSLEQFELEQKDQEVLINNKIEAIYKQAPILRNEISNVESILVKEVDHRSTYTGITFKAKREKKYRSQNISRPLLQKIAHSSYDGEINHFDLDEANRLITLAFDNAKEGIMGKVEKFSYANYKNYRSDKNFLEIFRSSKFVRNSLMSTTQSPEYIRKQIKQLDEKLQKETKSFSERVTSSLETLAIVTGMIAIGAVIVLAIAGTGGVAAPGIMAIGLSQLIFSEMVLSIGLITLIEGSRLHTNYIEVPAQLKFHESLAVSQVESGRTTDFETLEEGQSALRTGKAISIGLMPLNLFFGYTITRQIKSTMGYAGVNSFKKLTGLKMHKYSSPSIGNKAKKTFFELRKSQGVSAALKNSLKIAKERLPRYQNITSYEATTGALRVGIANKFRSLKIANEPEVIIEEMKLYANKLKDRVDFYDDFIKKQDELFARVRISDGFSSREVIEFGLENSKKLTTIKSFYKAMGEGDILNFPSIRREMITDLHKTQGVLMAEKVSKLDQLIFKIDNFSKNKSQTDNIDSLLRVLSDKEILLLEKISKDKFFLSEIFTGKQVGYLREFRSTFKDYHKVVEGLTPTAYKVGHPGVNFSKAKPDNHIFMNTNEEVTHFYEQMLKQNNFLEDEILAKVRKDFELKIARLFTVDQSGNRAYQ